MPKTYPNYPHVKRDARDIRNKRCEVCVWVKACTGNLCGGQKTTTQPEIKHDTLRRG